MSLEPPVCAAPPPSPALLNPDSPPGADNGISSMAQRSLSLTTGERSQLTRQLQCIAEDPEQQQQQASGSDPSTKPKQLTAAQQKRASLVKKAIRYFEDKSNRSVSEDNLFTRRKNLAVHLGLDEKVSKKEIQKINTYSLPVPSSATSFDIPDADINNRNVIVVDDDEDLRSKNLVHFLGMRDGFTASMASQGTLCDSPRNSTVSKVSPGSGSRENKDSLFRF